MHGRGPAVAVTVFGSDEKLGAGWAGPVERAGAAEERPGGMWTEIYVSDPGTAPVELRTDPVMPLG